MLKQLSQALHQFAENRAARARHAAEMDQLKSLSDRELADIGLTRADVRALEKDKPNV